MPFARPFPTSLLACLAASCLAASCHASPDLRELAAPIRDYTSVVTATQVNTAELTKISKDYARSYMIKTSRLDYRSPNHFRVSGNIGPITVTYVINGDLKSWKYGPVHGQRDVRDAPGQKQGLLDFGILTADQLDDYTWTFVREEMVNGKPLEVFEMRFKNLKKDPSRRIVWVDPVHKGVIVRRQIFKQYQDNVVKMDFRFERIEEVGAGLWSPTVIKVYNTEGHLGAVSRITGIRLNKGVSVSEFQL